MPAGPACARAPALRREEVAGVGRGRHRPPDRVAHGRLRHDAQQRRRCRRERRGGGRGAALRRHPRRRLWGREPAGAAGGGRPRVPLPGHHQAGVQPALPHQGPGHGQPFQAQPGSHTPRGSGDSLFFT